MGSHIIGSIDEVCLPILTPCFIVLSSRLRSLAIRKLEAVKLGMALDTLVGLELGSSRGDALGEALGADEGTTLGVEDNRQPTPGAQRNGSCPDARFAGLYTM